MHKSPTDADRNDVPNIPHPPNKGLQSRCTSKEDVVLARGRRFLTVGLQYGCDVFPLPGVRFFLLPLCIRSAKDLAVTSIIRRVAILTSFIMLLFAVGCGGPSGAVETVTADVDSAPPEAEESSDSTETRSVAKVPPDETAEVDPAVGTAQLVLAGGCFWCMEVAFDQLIGVTDVVSGYAGGTADTADYKTVSAGLTNHAESIRITYDPQVIAEGTLLRVFFTAAHDPTEVNRQYPDVGRQYRTAIFYANDEQQQRAARMIDQLNQSGTFDKKIATTLEPLTEFYPAEDYHQDYVKHNPRDHYVVAYSLPKAAKVRKLFPELIRE